MSERLTTVDERRETLEILDNLAGESDLENVSLERLTEMADRRLGIENVDLMGGNEIREAVKEKLGFRDLLMLDPGQAIGSLAAVAFDGDTDATLNYMLRKVKLYEVEYDESLPALPDKYTLEVSDPEATGVRLFKLRSEETDVTAVFVEFNEYYDIHAAIPWAGARTSRSDDPHDEIYEEIKDVSHADKVDMFFGYGHASIANMSPGMIHINNLPMYEAYWVFNHTSLVGGQESSTRYIELDNPTVTELESLTDLSHLSPEERSRFKQRWEAIQEKEHGKFKEWMPRIYQKFETFLKEEHPDVKDSTVKSRTLDTVRTWLPFGGRTSMSLQFDVREAINIITQFNERDDYYARELADQLTTLYKLKTYRESQDIEADLAGLMKYTEGYDTVHPNTGELQEVLMEIDAFQELVKLSEERASQPSAPHESRTNFVPANEFELGSEVIAGYVATILPNITTPEIVDFLNTLSAENRQEMISVIFQDHSHHNLLRNAADVRGHFMDIETALAYLRDFNRHRALGRLAVMLETGNYDAVVKNGFNRSHIIANTEVLQEFEKEWNEDFNDLYEDIYSFYDDIKAALGEDVDYGFMYHILPLGHQARLVMSGPLMQWNYFSHLRIRPGGDYGYREVTHDMVEAIAKHSVMNSFGNNLEKPDYNDASEVKDRS